MHPKSVRLLEGYIISGAFLLKYIINPLNSRQFKGFMFAKLTHSLSFRTMCRTKMAKNGKKTLVKMAFYGKMQLGIEWTIPKGKNIGK